MPAKAILFDTQGPLVWVIKPDFTVSRRHVQRGTADGEKVEIQSGLSPGDLVVIGAANNDLHEGEKIRYKLVQADGTTPAESAAAPTLSFGPVIVRVVNDMDTGTNFLLDLDMGKTFSLPPELKTEADVANAGNWYAKNGIDVRGRTKSWSPPMGLDLICDPVPLDYWDKLTQSNLNVFLQRHVDNYAFPGQAIGGTTGTDVRQPTYLFKTREGGIGLLQIIGLTDDPRGVKVRYKLMQYTATPRAGSAAAPNLSVGPVIGKDSAEIQSSPRVLSGAEAAQLAARLAVCRP